jgi:hypothetical protein
VEIEELKSVYLDVKKGVLEVNGQELKNVTEFSMTFKDGEFGLSVTRDDKFTSKTDGSRLFLELLPDKAIEGVERNV